MQSTLRSYVELIQSYQGRDKIVRLCSYAAAFLSGASRGNISTKFGVISKELSYARVILRLFDDLPMLTYTMRYGLGKHEESKLVQVLGVLSNLVNQSYFPIEHLAWGADKGLWHLQSPKLWIAGLFIWATSLTIGIISSLIKLGRIMTRRAVLCKQQNGEVLSADELQDPSSPQMTLRQLKKQELTEYLNVLKNVFDLLNAVHWLPPGILWSGKFSNTQSGLWGIISTAIGLYMYCDAQKAKAKKA